MSSYDKFKELGYFDILFKNKQEGAFWENFCNTVQNGSINTWDTQWLLSIWCNNGIVVLPNKNLVSNIGFNSDGTHTVSSNNALDNMPTYDMNEIIHPTFKIPNIDADTYTFKKIYEPKFIHKLAARFKK